MHTFLDFFTVWSFAYGFSVNSSVNTQAHTGHVSLSELHFVAYLAPSTAVMEELCLTLLSPPPADNELTVGKVYAALMIFDYYKQNRAKRLQQQNSSGGPQVQSVDKMLM